MTRWAELTHRSAALYRFRANCVMAPLKRLTRELFGFDVDAQRAYTASQAQLLRRLLQDAAVVELGCGTGLTPKARAKYGISRYVGTDASAGMVRDARRAQPDQWFVAARAEALPFADGSFDIVISRFLLHHVPAAARQQVLAEMLRVARRAVVIVDVYGFASGLRRPLYELYYRIADGSEYRFTLAEWDSFLRESGATLLEAAHCGEATLVNRIGHWVVHLSGPAAPGAVYPQGADHAKEQRHA